MMSAASDKPDEEVEAISLARRNLSEFLDEHAAILLTTPVMEATYRSRST
jgi:hypothetical protein